VASAAVESREGYREQDREAKKKVSLVRAFCLTSFYNLLFM